MRVTVKSGTPEQIRAFVQELTKILNRPVFRWNEDQTTNEPVFEIEVKHRKLETVQDIVEEVARSTGIKIWFWSYTYTKSINKTEVVS